MSTSRTRAIISALTVSSLWTHSLFPSASAKVVEAMQQVSALSLRRTCPPVIRSSDRCGCVVWEYRVSYLTGPVIRAHQFPLLVRHVTSKTTLAQTQTAILAAAAAQCDTLHITWGRRSATGCVPPCFSPSLRCLTRPVRICQAKPRGTVLPSSLHVVSGFDCSSNISHVPLIAIPRRAFVVPFVIPAGSGSTFVSQSYPSEALSETLQFG